MAAIRIGILGSRSSVDSIVGTSLCSIHAVADGGGEADGCQVGVDFRFGGWVQSYHRAGWRC